MATAGNQSSTLSKTKRLLWVSLRYVVFLCIGFAAALVVACNILVPTGLAVTPIKTSEPLVQVGTPLPLSGTPITTDTANRVQLLTRWGKGTSNLVAWSNDARSLAIAGSYGIYVYDANTLTQIRAIAVPSWVESVSLSADGQWIVSLSLDKSLRVWRVSDGSLVHEFKEMIATRFASDGTLATANKGHVIQYWQASDWILKKEFTLSSPNNRFRLDPVFFSPDASIVISMGRSAPPGSSNTLYVWRSSDGKFLRGLTPESGIYLVEKVVFSPDSNLVVVTTASDIPGSATYVGVWRVEDGGRVTQWTENYQVFDVAFSSVGDRITLSGGTLLGLGMTRTRQVNDGKLVNDWQGKPQINSVAYSPNGNQVVAISSDRVRMLRADDFKVISELQDWRPMTRASFSPDGKLVATTNDTNTALWRTNDGSLVREIKDEFWAGSVFSPDGTQFVSQNQDGIAHLWRVSDGSLVRELKLKLPEDKDARTFSIQFSPDWKIAATLSSGSSAPWPATLRLWQVSDGTMVRQLSGSPMNGVAKFIFSLDGTRIATVGHSASDNSARVWRVDTGEMIREINQIYIDNVAFSPDAKWIVIGGGDMIQIHQVSDGTLVQTLKTTSRNVYETTFSPDGKLFAAGSEDSIIRLWRVSDWSLLREFKAQRFVVGSLTFSPGANLLASGSWDSTVGLWGIPK